MEEAPENGKESSHFALPKGTNECMSETQLGSYFFIHVFND
jgi:hypothetical protein